MNQIIIENKEVFQIIIESAILTFVTMTAKRMNEIKELNRRQAETEEIMNQVITAILAVTNDNQNRLSNIKELLESKRNLP